jgi:hypothetical protein
MYHHGRPLQAREHQLLSLSGANERAPIPFRLPAIVGASGIRMLFFIPATLPGSIHERRRALRSHTLLCSDAYNSAFRLPRRPRTERRKKRGMSSSTLERCRLRCILCALSLMSAVLVGVKPFKGTLKVIKAQAPGARSLVLISDSRIECFKFNMH